MVTDCKLGFVKEKFFGIVFKNKGKVTVKTICEFISDSNKFIRDPFSKKAVLVSICSFVRNNVRGCAADFVVFGNFPFSGEGKAKRHQ